MSQKTKNDLLYTVIGVLLMVPVITAFNKYLIFKNFMDYPLTTGAFWKSVLVGICQRVPVVFPLQFFVVQKIAEKHTAMHTKPDDDWLYVAVIRTGFSVIMLCPILSFYANMLLVIDGTIKGVPAFINNWIPKMFINGLFAFMYQVFVAGPLNRAIFLAIIRRKSKKAAAK